MVTTEMMKLISFLVGGTIIAAVGQIIIIKHKNKKELEEQGGIEEFDTSQEQQQPETQLSKEEETARNYISQYKSQYPKESLKQGLLNYNISDENAEKYLNKYF